MNCVDLWGLSASDSSRTTSINGKTYLTVNANDDQEFLDVADAYFGSLKYGTAGNIKVDGMALTNADGSVLHAFSTEEAIQKYYESLITDNKNTIVSLSTAELIGELASDASLVFNAASLACVLIGNFPLAGAFVLQQDLPML